MIVNLTVTVVGLIGVFVRLGRALQRLDEHERRINGHDVDLKIIDRDLRNPAGGRVMSP